MQHGYAAFTGASALDLHEKCTFDADPRRLGERSLLRVVRAQSIAKQKRIACATHGRFHIVLHVGLDLFMMTNHLVLSV